MRVQGLGKGLLARGEREEASHQAEGCSGGPGRPEMKARVRVGEEGLGGGRKRVAGRLLFSFLPSAYQRCCKPYLSNLVSALSNFALEVNCEGSFKSRVQFSVCLSGLHVYECESGRERGHGYLVLQL